jgi:hypothetical protein
VIIPVYYVRLQLSTATGLDLDSGIKLISVRDTVDSYIRFDLNCMKLVYIWNVLTLSALMGTMARANWTVLCQHCNIPRLTHN